MIVTIYIDNKLKGGNFPRSTAEIAERCIFCSF